MIKRIGPASRIAASLRWQQASLMFRNSIRSTFLQMKRTPTQRQWIEVPYQRKERQCLTNYRRKQTSWERMSAETLIMPCKLMGRLPRSNILDLSSQWIDLQWRSTECPSKGVVISYLTLRTTSNLKGRSRWRLIWKNARRRTSRSSACRRSWEFWTRKEGKIWQKWRRE